VHGQVYMFQNSYMYIVMASTLYVPLECCHTDNSHGIHCHLTISPCTVTLLCFSDGQEYSLHIFICVYWKIEIRKRFPADEQCFVLTGKSTGSSTQIVFYPWDQRNLLLRNSVPLSDCWIFGNQRLKRFVAEFSQNINSMKTCIFWSYYTDSVHTKCHFTTETKLTVVQKNV